MKLQTVRINQVNSAPAPILPLAVSKVGRALRHLIPAASLALACQSPDSAEAGGTVVFANSGSSKVINWQTGNPVMTNDQIRAALYWAPQGSNTFSQIGNTINNVGFPLPGIFADGTRTTGADTPGGATAQFQVRAWGGGFATYEQAATNSNILIGASSIILMPTGNPGGTPPTPANSLVGGGLQSFTLKPNTALTLNCPTNKTFYCTNAWAFDSPSGSTTCADTNLQITVIGTTTNSQGCSQILTRTWEITDACGNTNTCSQAVTLVNTNPPVMACTTNKTVTCGSAWIFDPPSAFNACDGSAVGVSILSTFTNGACPQLATRIWIAYNPCTNASATCTQTVTVVDTTATLFADDFDADHTANWVVNKSTGVNANDAGSSAEFFFDYSTVGIPSAPHSVGGTTRGLRLRADMSGNIFSGLSVSPAGQSFTGDYRLEFDLWMNYNGPLGPGGNGTTQLGGAGIGTRGTTAQWAGGTQDSLWFATTGDGNSSLDYRAYSPVYPTGYPASSGVYLAGTGPSAQNNTDPYYAFLAPSPAPAAQIALYPQQTDSTYSGAVAFAWRDVVITKVGNRVSWSVDGVVMASVDTSALALSTNILFNYFDSNASSSTDPNAPNLLFALIDNVRVEGVTDFNCSTNKTVNCDSNWDFDPPSGATCTGSNLAVTVVSTFTNGTCPQVISRIWSIVNPCSGQTNLCSQTVTVVNTNPPVMACSTNKTVNCSDNWTFDPPTAYDTCAGGNMPVFVLSTVTNGVCPPVATRIWIASNACNSASATCTQVVTAVDTTPPVITCASNKTVSSDLFWSFDPPSAYDSCCGSNVTVQLLSSNAVVLNYCTTVWTALWQASDCCSNTSYCMQTVTVVPPVVPGTNSWTSLGSGSWGASNTWSLGRPPQAGDFILITNPFSKTITIDPFVSPCTLTVSNFILGAAGGFGSNTLVLAAGSTNPPLHVLNNFTVDDGGTVSIPDSLLQVDGLTTVGTSGAATFTLDAGAVQSGGLALGSGSNGVGQFNLGGGTLTAWGDLTLGSGPTNSTGLLSATGGAVSVTGTLGIGNDGSSTNGSGSGTATFANVSVNAATMILGSTAGGLGSLTIQSNALVSVGADLSIVSGSLSSTSTVSITGGSLVASNGTTRVGPSGIGRLTITGGSHILRVLDLGGTNSSGSFFGYGGHLKILETLIPNFTVVSGIDLDGSGGTIIIGDSKSATLLVGAGTATNFANMKVGYILTPAYTGTYTQVGGVTEVTNSLVVGDCASGAQGTVNLSGGATYVTNSLGTATLDLQMGTVIMDSGSTLVADTLNLSGSCGQFIYHGGTLHYKQLVLPPDAPPLVLTIALDSQAATVTLSWPAIYVGYGLQETPDPSQSEWTAINPNPTDVGPTRSVTLPLGTGSMFYRLAKP